ncbi:hypothetical protein HPB50_017711 [Hyalomma asiaticum]|uniref:Uncharacterized protein n=1 Tax=Hyalomma asiaticum TaxID=266040 RepID=A0ACB7SGB9_HYAAI|nr:hypothetical protein HPB50_017711 [Hyalomma asiaticum]
MSSRSRCTGHSSSPRSKRNGTNHVCWRRTCGDSYGTTIPDAASLRHVLSCLRSADRQPRKRGCRREHVDLSTPTLLLLASPLAATSDGHATSTTADFFLPGHGKNTNERRCTGHPTAGKGRRADSVADTKRVAEDLDKDVGRRRPHFLEGAAEDNQSGSSTARRSHVAIRPEEVSRDRRDKDSEGARPRLESCDGVTSCRGSPTTTHMGTERGVCT